MHNLIKHEKTNIKKEGLTLMKIMISILLLCGLFLFGDVTILNTNNDASAEQKAPPYAKWGRVAMSKTKEKYPQAEIIDYLHIGRDKGPQSSTEKFKLWLKTNNREFGVFIDITFDNKTEKILDIKFRETTR
jgi:hypothetical protein